MQTRVEWCDRARWCGRAADGSSALPAWGGSPCRTL